MNVSIVTPTFNRKEILKRSINSSLELLWKNIVNEIIIVDDASTDGTVEFLNKKYYDEINKGVIKVFSLPTNIGVTGAKNYGADFASSEWIVFMDSDDYFIENSGNLLCQELSQLDEYSLVFFRCEDNKGKLIGRYRPASEIKLHELFNIGTPGECLPVIKKSCLKKYPYYQKLRGCEGLAYFKMLHNGEKAFVSEIVLRKYDDSGLDRLCTKSAIKKRAKQLFLYNLECLKYIKYASLKKVLSISSRIFYYAFKTIIPK